MGGSFINIRSKIGQIPGLNTEESRKNDFIFIASLDQGLLYTDSKECYLLPALFQISGSNHLYLFTADGEASGQVVLDDGISLNTIQNGL